MSFGTSYALTTRPLVMGRHGAVVTGHHLASQAALDTLRMGGNAIDAGIAAAACLAVLKPDACGLGSDLFLLYAERSSGETFALNASGPAPQLAGLDAFPGNTIAPLGLRAASVPGAVDGWYQAVTRFGRHALADTLAPAIALARDGFPVSALFAAALERNATLLRDFQTTRDTFYPHRRVPFVGELFVQPDAARTIAAIAQGGSDAFYRGAFAQALDTASRAQGALLRAEDLRDYKSAWYTPLHATYRGYEIFAAPPVSVGILVPQTMKILENFPIGEFPDSSAERIHLQVEAMKLAAADLGAYIGDPDFVPENPSAALLDTDYGARRAAEIDRLHAKAFAPGSFPVRAGSDTSYVAVIDSDGNAVSLLQSVFHGFGCGVVVPQSGVLMNNRMLGFSLDPASPNVVAPRKRPMHTLNPVLIARDGCTFAALGTPGGPSQVYTNAALLMRLLDDALEAQRALDAPRWFLTPQGTLRIESSVGDEVLAALAARGHDVVAVPPQSAAMGGAGIARINRFSMREAAADPRRESYALAY